MTGLDSSFFPLISAQAVEAPLLNIVIGSAVAAVALNYIPPLLRLNHLSYKLLYVFFLPIQRMLWDGPEIYYAMGGRDGLRVTCGMISAVVVGKVLNKFKFSIRH